MWRKQLPNHAARRREATTTPLSWASKAWSFGDRRLFEMYLPVMTTYVFGSVQFEKQKRVRRFLRAWVDIFTYFSGSFWFRLRNKKKLARCPDKVLPHVLVFLVLYGTTSLTRSASVVAVRGLCGVGSKVCPSITSW